MHIQGVPPKCDHFQSWKSIFFAQDICKRPTNFKRYGRNLVISVEKPSKSSKKSHFLNFWKKCLKFYTLFFEIAANTPPNYIISSNHPHFWRHEKWDYSNHPQRPILQQSPPYTSSVLKWFLAHFITTANTPLGMLRLQQSPPLVLLRLLIFKNTRFTG